jgi:hypothetical protein
MRTDARKSYVTNVSYRIFADKNAIIPIKDEAFTQNISEGGLCLLVNKELSPGVVLELKFELPGKKSNPIETRVKVVWQQKIEKGYLTGVKFGIG